MYSTFKNLPRVWNIYLEWWGQDFIIGIAECSNWKRCTLVPIHSLNAWRNKAYNLWPKVEWNSYVKNMWELKYTSSQYIQFELAEYLIQTHKLDTRAWIVTQLNQTDVVGIEILISSENVWNIIKWYLNHLHEMSGKEWCSVKDN